MDNVEDRVATLEGRILEQSMRIDHVRDTATSIDASLYRHFDSIDRKLNWSLGIAIATLIGMFGQCLKH